MGDVKLLDAGGDILISGETRDEVDAVLQDLLGRGAKIISPLTPVGRSWVAACSPPPKVHDADRTTTLDLREILAAQRQRRPGASLCRVEEAGLKRIITGPSYEAVNARLAEFLEQGATLVSEPEENFGSWIAVCDTPEGKSP
jgi:predicted enzyme related to lactoylglutathione lyase